MLASPGVDGIGLCAVRAERGWDGRLVDAHDARQVPGRKTDVQDGQGRQALPASGLRRGAWRPEDEVGVLRRSVRPRRRRGAMASRAGQPRQNALAQMHRKLTEVVREITGQTGMTMIRALLEGARASQGLATPREKRGTHDHATIAQALPGPGRAAPRLAWPQAVDQDEVLAQPLRACDGHSEACLQPLVPAVEGDALPSPPVRAWRARRSNPLRVEVPPSREAMTGGARTQSDGIDSLTALQGIRERGLARTRWPTRTPCASGLG